MIKYYTRACNFYYGKHAAFLIRKKKALPLCGNKNFAFDSIEIFKRKNRNVSIKLVQLKEIKKLSKNLQIKIKKDLKKISNKRKNFLKSLY